MTKVINLFGGPGCGKSTLSAELYAQLKCEGKNVELVREYVKDWAYEKRTIGKYDQLYIAGKQAKKETSLYGKVDIIITDSPMLLSPFYQKHYQGETFVEHAIFNLMRVAREEGVEYINILLNRNKKYNPVGRYENEEQAVGIDSALLAYLKNNDVKFNKLGCSDSDKVGVVLDIVNSITDDFESEEF